MDSNRKSIQKRYVWLGFQTWWKNWNGSWQISYLKFTSIAKEEKEAKEHFDSGYNVGHEEGLTQGMNLKIEKSKEISSKEYEEVCKFLAERNLVISYSSTYMDKFSCGLMIRKNNG